MTYRRVLLKAAAVASSVGLVATFVAYRAGAFDRLLAPEPPAPAQVVTTPESLAPTPPEGTPAFMYGSKSGVFLELPPGQPTANPTPGPPPTVMSGSKSLFIAPGTLQGLTPAPGTPPPPANLPPSPPPANPAPTPPK